MNQNIKIDFFLLFICIAITNVLFSQQTIIGKVMMPNYTPISYVNIGIAGENIGTVSAESGNFSLEIPSRLLNSELTFSAIGYKTVKYPLTNATKEILAFMDEEVYQVDEIVVNGNKLNSKELGIKVEKDNVQAGFSDNSLGAEVAIRMDVKRKEIVYPNSIHFRLSENDCDSLFFRVNFYSVKSGRPGNNITPKSIFFTTKGIKGNVELDLTPYNLSFEDDFFVSLEWVRDQCPRMVENGINFSAALFKKMYYRQTSQAKWSKLSAVAVGIWLEVGYEKK